MITCYAYSYVKRADDKLLWLFLLHSNLLICSEFSIYHKILVVVGSTLHSSYMSSLKLLVDLSF